MIFQGSGAGNSSSGISVLGSGSLYINQYSVDVQFPKEVAAVFIKSTYVNNGETETAMAISGSPARVLYASGSTSSYIQATVNGNTVSFKGQGQTVYYLALG